MPGSTPSQKPVPVELHQPSPTPIEMLSDVIGPLVGPLGTAGLTLILVVFMLIERSELRDRLIRLLGDRDIMRSTQTMDEGAKRISRYLLMQLTINVLHGTPYGIGLWLIGVPNPLLWGLLAVLLRFIPYLGPLVGGGGPSSPGARGRSRLDHGRPDARPHHRARVLHRQRSRALALWLDHRPVALGYSRRRRLLDHPLGPHRSSPLGAAHRVCRRAGPPCAAAAVPGYAPRRPPCPHDACPPLPASPRRRAPRGDGARRGSRGGGGLRPARRRRAPAGPRVCRARPSARRARSRRSAAAGRGGRGDRRLSGLRRRRTSDHKDDAAPERVRARPVPWRPEPDRPRSRPSPSGSPRGTGYRRGCRRRHGDRKAPDGLSGQASPGRPSPVSRISPFPHPIMPAAP